MKFSSSILSTKALTLAKFPTKQNPLKQSIVANIIMQYTFTISERNL